MDMDGSRQQQQQQRRRRRRRRGSSAPAQPPDRPRTVPIAVTPDGFWCCPSPAALHKSLLKTPPHHHNNKQSPAPAHKTLSAPPSRATSVQTAPSVTDDDDPVALITVQIARRIALETDNLLWLVEMLLAVSSQRGGDDGRLVALWSEQAEMAAYHARVPAASRHAVSRVTARLFVGVGRGELLPPKHARLRLLQVWLHPLIDDYAWLQRGSAAFDRRLVEDGIGQTILTLPLEEQRSILLDWFVRFLKLSDDCPNLQRAFQVWWRRTFVRPFVLHRHDSDAGDVLTLDRS